MTWASPAANNLLKNRAAPRVAGLLGTAALLSLGLVLLPVEQAAAKEGGGGVGARSGGYGGLGGGQGRSGGGVGSGPGTPNRAVATPSVNSNGEASADGPAAGPAGDGSNGAAQGPSGAAMGGAMNAAAQSSARLSGFKTRSITSVSGAIGTTDGPSGLSRNSPVRAAPASPAVNSNGEAGSDGAPGAAAPGSTGTEGQPVVGGEIGARAAASRSGDGSGRGARGSGREMVTGEVVVINEDITFYERARGFGFVKLEEKPLGSLGLTVVRLRVPDRMTPYEARGFLRDRFPNLMVDVNNLYRPAGAARSLPAPDYAKTMIGWPEVGPACGAGLAIGMMDTGVAVAAPAFQGHKISQRSFVAPGREAAAPDHGTAIAGVLVGQGEGADRGLLPGATLSVAEIFQRGEDDDLPAANAVSFASGLDWLVGSGVRLVNMSLAGPDNRLIAMAVARAADKGTIMVAAAGNNGPQGAPVYPAAYPDVMGVTALGPDLKPFDQANRGDFVRFAAPGVKVWTATPDGQGRYRSGTSVAAAYVTAAAGAELIQDPKALPADISRRLEERAELVDHMPLVKAAAVCGAPAVAIR